LLALPPKSPQASPPTRLLAAATNLEERESERERERVREGERERERERERESVCVRERETERVLAAATNLEGNVLSTALQDLDRSTHSPLLQTGHSWT